METLEDRIERDGPLNALDAVGWVIRIAKHLESLHVHGVAHGGMSLSAVVTAGPDRNAKGLMSDVRLITENSSYHSPELVQGGNLTPADDTWALAVLLYKALTGQAPFSGVGNELKQSIMTSAPAPLAVFDVGDDDLQRVLTLSLDTDPSRRLASVKQFREQLERWHPDPSVTDLPPLDDEDEGDEAEARTVMHEHASSIWDESTKSGDASDPVFAPVDLSGGDDDDELDLPRQEEQTVMRELPAHIMAMAARSALGSNPPPAPDAAGDKRGDLPSLTDPGGPPSGVTQPAHLPTPRPAAGSAAIGAKGTLPPGAPALASTRVALPRVVPPPAIPRPGMPPPAAVAPPPPADLPIDFDDDDDEVRTIMRTSDHDVDVDDDEDGDEARTVMRDAPVFSMPMPGAPPAPPAPPTPPTPPAPLAPPVSSGPLGSPPGAFPPPSAGFAPPSAAVEHQPAPASSPPTMALPSDGFAAIAAELASAAPDGGLTPSSPDFFNAPLGANLNEPASGGTVPMSPFSGPPSGAAPGFGGPPGPPAPMSMGPGQPMPMAGPYDAQPPPQPDYGDASPTSRNAVFIVSVLALVAAAAITYVVLRYRAQLNLPFSVTIHAAPWLR